MSALAAGPAAPTLRAVVCDDDSLIRTVVARVAGQAGVEVVAEAESPEEAVELVQRYGADELILDLSLTGGRGETALDLVRNRGLRCRTIVFSAFADDPDRLMQRGAAAVVLKPDFEGLERVLGEHAATEPPVAGERRRPRDPRRHPPVPRFVSPSGVAPPDELWDMLDALVPGDAVMSVRIEGMTHIAHEHGQIVAADHLLHAARVARHTLRVQDRMAVGEDGSLVLLIVDGHGEAAEAVFERMQREWASSGAMGRLTAGFALCVDGVSRRATLAAAIAALATDTDPDRPLAEG